MDLKGTVDLFDIIKSGATTLAFAIGGIWTYLLFIRRRQRFPRADLSHTLKTRQLAPGKRLLHIGIRVKNIGEVMIRLVEVNVRVQQIRPLTEDAARYLGPECAPPQDEPEYRWPCVAGPIHCDWTTSPREIEPGETDIFYFDFVISPEVETIEIYSYLRNQRKKKRIGWNATSLHDLEEGREHVARSPEPPKAVHPPTATDPTTHAAPTTSAKSGPTVDPQTSPGA